MTPPTFVSLLGLLQVDLGDGFEVNVPQPDAAVSASGGEAFLAGIHAEDASLNTHNVVASNCFFF